MAHALCKPLWGLGGGAKIGLNMVRHRHPQTIQIHDCHGFAWICNPRPSQISIFMPLALCELLWGLGGPKIGLSVVRHRHPQDELWATIAPQHRRKPNDVKKHVFHLEYCPFFLNVLAQSLQPTETRERALRVGYVPVLPIRWVNRAHGVNEQHAKRSLVELGSLLRR